MYLGQEPEQEPYNISVEVQEPYYRTWLILAFVALGVWIFSKGK